MICNIAAMEGVCDTPLHLFDHFTGNMMVERNDNIWRFSPFMRGFQSNNRMRVSHTPSKEQKRNDGGHDVISVAMMMPPTIRTHSSRCSFSE